MKAEWAALDLACEPYKQTDTYILSKMEETLQMLDDHLIKTQVGPSTLPPLSLSDTSPRSPQPSYPPLPPPSSSSPLPPHLTNTNPISTTLIAYQPTPRRHSSHLLRHPPSPISCALLLHSLPTSPSNDASYTLLV